MHARIIFGITLAAEAILGGSLILTLLRPGFRAWPPLGRDTWQYRLTWSMTIVSALGILVVGLLDWGSLPLLIPLRVGLGPALMLVGTALALWAVHTLSYETSLGLGGALVREGPYRLSRNPQYVGDIALITGYVMLSSSWMALISGAMATVWFVLAPFTEEPWLRQQHGEEYEAFLDSVPRFLGVPSRENAG
jgi:protein-S-isoprenylcysteine O-methyltransferase Ste14